MTDSTLLTTRQAATILRMSPRTIQRMAERGELPYAHKLPGVKGPYMFDRAVVELFARQLAAAAALAEAAG